MSRRRYLHAVAHSVEFGLGVAVVISSLFFVFTPGSFDETSLGQSVPPWLAVLWISGYCTGGAGIMIGLLWPSLVVEFAGVLMLTGGLFANSAAIILAAGGRGVGSTCAFAGLALGLLVRAYVLSRLGRGR